MNPVLILACWLLRHLRWVGGGICGELANRSTVIRRLRLRILDSYTA